MRQVGARINPIRGPARSISTDGDRPSGSWLAGAVETVEEVAFNFIDQDQRVQRR